METETVALGNSLHVPSVKELTKESLTNVPFRYVRFQEQDQTLISDKTSPVSSEDYQVPVLDMQRLISEDSMDSELEKLHSACKEWGFFQVMIIVLIFRSVFSKTFSMSTCFFEYCLYLSNFRSMFLKLFFFCLISASEPWSEFYTVG